MSDLDYGLLAKALGVALAAKGVKSHMNARNINKYAQRSGVNYDVGNFYGADTQQAYDQIDAMVKAKQDQSVSDYYSQHAGLPSGPLEAVKTMYTTEAGPRRLAKQKMEDEGDYNQGVNTERMEFEAQNPQLFGYAPAPYAQPAQSQQSLPVPGDTTGMLELDPILAGQGQPLQASATQYGNFYQGTVPRLSPAQFNDMMSQGIQRRNARTNERRVDQTVREYEEVGKPYKQAQIELAKTRMKKVLQDMQLNPMKVKAYIDSLKRRQGRAPSKVEIAQQMLKNGDITKEQFRDFIIKAPEINILDGILGTPSPPGLEGDAGSEADAYLNGE